jgi:hypothetical protein
MVGTGNDIVALAAININRTKQTNFYSKILLPAEKLLYDQTLSDQLSFENFVWLAWSIKESVYKFRQRAAPELIFSPSKINLTQLQPPYDGAKMPALAEGCGFESIPVYKGLVESGGDIFYSRSLINKDMIFSVVNNHDDFASTHWGIRRIDSPDVVHQSETVRLFLTKRLKELFPGGDFRIDKSPHGWPVVLNGETELSLPVSFAHHAHYIAYSFQLK